MKKILAMFTILMTTIQVGQADDRISMTPNGTVSTSYYVPFLKDTRKRWSGYCVLKNGEEFLVWTFERQDTIIAGKTYSVIEYQGRETLLFYERQEGKKVYRYDEDTQAEVLMVDYSLEVGDEVEVDGGVKMKVVKTESAYETIPMYGLRNSKMMRLQGVDDETLEDVWVEGVGSIYWGVLPRGKMTDVEQMYVANVSFSFSEGNASFTINTERYKSCLLHYRNLTQEEKEFVETLDPFKPEKLDIHFVDDTLCVTGILYFKPYDYQIDCLLDGTNIALNIYMIDLYDYFESPHTYYVEAKFPGFKEGVHHVSYNGGELVEVVCGEVKAENIPFVQDLILREVDSYKEEAFYYEFVDDKLHLYGNVKTGLADGIALQCIIYDDIVDIAPIESPDMLVTTPSMYRADAWFNVVESDVKMVTYKGKQIEERNYQEAPYMTEMSAEGVPIRFCVLDEINKTCMVGVGDYDSPAIDANIRGAVTIPSMVDGYFVKKVCAKAFASCAIDSLIIPEGVKVIGAEMVDGCANLKHITIPSSAEWIGPQAFYTGYDLSSVVTYIREPSMLWPAKYVFTTSGDTDLGINHCANATLYVPLDTKKEYQQYRDWKQFAHIVEMETDKIQDVHIDKRSQHAYDVYYDLTGRHVTTPTKGMYIRNGKKVLVR